VKLSRTSLGFLLADLSLAGAMDHSWGVWER
jgi:hypothetical protein